MLRAFSVTFWILIASLLSVTGYIKVGGASTGWVSSSPSAPLGHYVVAPTRDLALDVTLLSADCPSLPTTFDIYAPLDARYASYPFLALGSFRSRHRQVGDLALSKKSGGIGFLVASNYTAAKTHAQGDSPAGPIDVFGSESRVWSLSCYDLRLRATWTGAYGTQVPVSFLNNKGGALDVTGNLKGFQDSFEVDVNSLVSSSLLDVAFDSPDY